MNFLSHRATRGLGLVSFSLLLACAAGCSSSSSGTGSPSGSGSSSETAGDQCNRIGAAYCARYTGDCASSSAPSGKTVGDQCNELAQAFCPQVVSCGQATSTATCTTQFVQGCCDNTGNCGTAAGSDEASVQTCATALTALTCADITSQNTPASCKGVVRSTTPPSLADCKSQVTTVCCGNSGTCGNAALSSSSSIDTCIADVDAAACGALQSAVPASCQGVVKIARAPLHVASERAAARDPIGAIGGDLAASPFAR